MEVIGTSEFNDSEGCPKTFTNIVYIYNIRIYKYMYKWQKPGKKVFIPLLIEFVIRGHEINKIKVISELT